MEKITLEINGENVPLTEFPKNIIIKTILGMLSALKGVDEIKFVEIKIEK